MVAPLTVASADPQTNLKSQAEAPAKASIAQRDHVLTQNGTLAIQLLPAPIIPAPPLPFYLNTAIIVPIVTLLGIAVTVWLGWWKTRKELSASNEKWKVDREDARSKTETDRVHAAEEARKARLVVARREVYLELVKEMTGASMALGSMPLNKEEVIDIQGGFKGFLSAAARVAVLGEMDTVVKSRELMNLVNKVLYKKLPEIFEMKLVKAEEAKHEQGKKWQLDRSESIKAVMTDLLKDKNRLGDVKPWADALEKSDAEAKKYAEQAALFSNAHAVLAQAYQRSLIEDTAEIAQKTNELILCIRAELELSSDSALLESSTREMYASAKEAIENMQEYYNK